MVAAGDILKEKSTTEAKMVEKVEQK